jgi:hypothetical protein
MLHRAENTSIFYGGAQFKDLNAQQIPAGRGLLAFKFPYAKGQCRDVRLSLKMSPIIWILEQVCSRVCLLGVYL